MRANIYGAIYVASISFKGMSCNQPNPFSVDTAALEKVNSAIEKRCTEASQYHCTLLENNLSASVLPI